MKLCRTEKHDLDVTGRDNKGGCKMCRRGTPREAKRARRAPAALPQALYAVPVATNDWQAKARCDADTAELFFDQEFYHEAAKLCYDCPVRAMCLESNLYEQYGYAGGMTPKQRQTMVKHRRTRGMDAEYTPLIPNKPKPKVPRQQPAQLSDEDCAEIVELWESGKGLRKVSEETGIPRSQVHRFIMSTGRGRTPEEQAKLSDNNRTLSKYAAEGREIAEKLFKEGYTVPEVAKMIDRRETTVYGIRRALIRKGLLPSD